MKSAFRLPVAIAALFASAFLIAQDEVKEIWPGVPSRWTGPEATRALNSLNETQRVEAVLTWLINERRYPSPITKGYIPEWNNSFYRQAQLVHGLQKEDPKPLRWLVESGKINSKEMRALVGMGLAFCGDPRADPYMIEVLQKSTNPFMREKAADRLVMWRNQRVIDALETAAASDQFHIEKLKRNTLNEMYDAYTVRELAQKSLKIIKLDRPQSQWTMDHFARFERLMQGYDEYVKTHKEDLERIAKLINTDKPARRRRSE